MSICDKCEKSFTSFALLRRHINEYHSLFVEAEMNDGTSLCLVPRNGSFTCVCDVKSAYSTASGFRKHVKKCTVLKNVSFFSEAQEEEVEEVIDAKFKILPPKLNLPEMDWQSIPCTRREYDHALLHACRATDWDAEQQTRLLTIMGAYHLRPLAICGSSTDEENALTHEYHLKNMDLRNADVSPIASKKRKLSHSIDVPMSASLFSSVVSGPYLTRILKCNYTEMNDTIATFLNKDWIESPQMRYACSRLLAGMIFLDSSTGKSILVNCVEVYGRTRSLDSHCESFYIKQGVLSPSSYPPEDAKYGDVYPTTLTDSDGTKLLLGTTMFNALVTSSLRLDQESPANIGPTTSTLIIDTEEKSNEIKLFVKQTSWDAAQQLASDAGCQSITGYHHLYQLRQLRSKFHHVSTYFRCRAADRATDDPAKKPYTVFTLVDWPTGDDNAEYRVASTLFRATALAVFANPERPLLARQTVDALYARLQNNQSDIKSIFAAVLDLFQGESIDILGNTGLNRQLKRLATLIASSISRANNTVATAISSSFK